MPTPVAKALGATRTPSAVHGMSSDNASASDREAGGPGARAGVGADAGAGADNTGSTIIGRPRSGSRDTGGSQQGTMMLSRVAGRPTTHIAHTRAHAVTAPAESSSVFFDDDNSNSDPGSDEEVTL